MARRGFPFDRLDIDGNGKISKDEVLQVYASVDTDGDGAVTREELIKAIVSHVNHRVPIDEKRGTTVPQTGEGDHDHRPDGIRGFRPEERRPDGIEGHRGRRDGDGPGRRGPPSANEIMERFDKDHKGSDIRFTQYRTIAGF